MSHYSVNWWDHWVSQPVMVILNPKIVIVGSGVSGLAAAVSLVKAGFRHVRVLEATKRSGGRIKTSNLGECFFSKTLNHCLTLNNFFFPPCYFCHSCFNFCLNVERPGVCWWADLFYLGLRSQVAFYFINMRRSVQYVFYLKKKKSMYIYIYTSWCEWGNPHQHRVIIIQS